jgi:hypothetical protein
VSQVIAHAGLHASECHLTTASLEDVFVAATQARKKLR